MTKLAPFVAFAVLLLWSHVSAQQDTIDLIAIESSWGGLGSPVNDKLTIESKKKGFYIGGNLVDPALIADLLTSVDSEELATPTLQNLDLTPEWLAANAQRGIDEYASGYFATTLQTQKDLYFRSFTDARLIEGLLPNVLRGGWTDDYPRLKVSIRFRSKAEVLIETDNQPPFMLPWTIVRDRTTTTTYNPRISRAVAALLPKKFANRDRVAGNWFSRELARSVMRTIESDWKRLGAEHKAGKAIDRLKENYKVESVEITNTHGVDHGKEWLKGNPQESNFFAVLRNEEYPTGFSIRIILPFQNEKVENLDLFEGKIDQHFLSVRKVKWLANLLDTGRYTVWLRYVKSRSFSEKAMEQFAADMRILGKQSLVAEVEKVQGEVALLSVGGGLDYYQSYWLVLPDQKVILWRYGYSPILPVSVDKLEARQCSDYHSGIVKCIGAEISKDGHLSN